MAFLDSEGEQDLTQSSESEPRGVCWDLQETGFPFAAGRDPGELMAAIMEIVGHLLKGANLKDRRKRSQFWSRDTTNSLCCFSWVFCSL